LLFSLWFSVLCFLNSPFSFILAIVLSVLRLRTSGYPFGIFKILFSFNQLNNMYNLLMITLYRLLFKPRFGYSVGRKVMMDVRHSFSETIGWVLKCSHRILKNHCKVLFV